MCFSGSNPHEREHFAAEKHISACYGDSHFRKRERAAGFSVTANACLRSRQFSAILIFHSALRCMAPVERDNAWRRC